MTVIGQGLYPTSILYEFSKLGLCIRRVVAL